jgi:hypothetical protein
MIKTIKRFVYHRIKKNFEFFEKHMKVHLIPIRYDSPIPITNELNPDVYDKIYECRGIDWNLEEQLRYLEIVFPKYSSEYTPDPNAGLSLVDAFALYAMIRERKPGKMIEIGAGESTKISLLALEANKKEGHECELYSIDPYPRDYLKKMKKDNFQLLQKKVQDVDISFFNGVDLLFIDSTHVCKIGSDVNYEILEIIPTLRVGAVIHWHDIVIPNNYYEYWIRDSKFWNESYMVHAFMMFNHSFKIIWAARYMQLNQYEKIRTEFPYFQPNHKLSSYWIERMQ